MLVWLQELKPDLKKLEEANSTYCGNDTGFIQHIYKTFPPKNKHHKLPAAAKLEAMDRLEVKKVLQKAVLHYHPDKVDAEKHGIKWKLLCEDITKQFTRRYECYK